MGAGDARVIIPGQEVDSGSDTPSIPVRIGMRFTDPLK
jgi:hypothetical protein